MDRSTPKLSPGHQSNLPSSQISSWWSASPPVSRRLLDKAEKRNGELTPIERLYLLSSLDLPGKALAYPDTVTEDERNLLIGRPPPRILSINISRLFKVTDQVATQESLEDRGDAQREEKEPKPMRQPTTVAEVVKAFQDPARLATLSHWATRCIMRNWWTVNQYDPPLPWMNSNGEVTAAGDAAWKLLQSMRPTEWAFENAARDFHMSRRDRNIFGDDLFDTPALTDPEEMMKQYQSDAELLREQLREEVAEKLALLSVEDQTTLQALRETTTAEVEQEAVEDKLRREREPEERKRKAQQEADEKRANRAGRKMAKLHVDDSDDDDDDDDAGYILGSANLDLE